MKKIKALLIAVCAIGMMAGSAWAANGDLLVTAKTDIPAEAAATMKAKEQQLLQMMLLQVFSILWAQVM